MQIAGPKKSYITENGTDVLGDAKIKKVEICGFFTLFLDENNDLYQTGYQTVQSCLLQVYPKRY